MDSKRASELFIKHSTAMAYVDVELPDGDRSIGSAFHIGEGVFVTARHVIENNKIVEIKITEPVPVPTAERFPHWPPDAVEEYDREISSILGDRPLFKYWPEALRIEKGPYYHEDPRVDLAVFKVENIHPAAGVVRLGLHLDDWVYRVPWWLSEAIIMGYPPIPLTNEPHLIGARAEIHTYVVLRGLPNVHFILSATPRGGFSGGLALHEEGFALGVVSGSLTKNDAPPETGFLAVLSVEPIHTCLKRNELVPKCQQENWDRLLEGRARKTREG